MYIISKVSTGSEWIVQKTFNIREYHISMYTNDTRHNAKFYQQTFIHSIENVARFHLTNGSIACLSDDI